MVTVEASIHKGHFATRIHTASHEIIADESIADGGEDKGFTPSELLASSLAACTSITLNMYAGRKKLNLEKVEVKISMSTDHATNITNIERSIKLSGNLTQEEQQKLLHIANHCPIHRLLSNPINIKTTLYE